MRQRVTGAQRRTSSSNRQGTPGRSTRATMALARLGLVWMAPALIGLAGVPAAQAAAQGPQRANWVNSWQGSPTQGATFDTKSCPSDVGVQDQTVRNIVYLSTGGDHIRVRVSNAGGTAPLRIGAASVAPSSGDGPGLEGDARALHFGGAQAIVVPAGGEALSDVIDLPVKPLDALAISVYLPAKTGPATQHFLATQTSYLSDGNQAAGGAAVAFTRPVSCWMFVSGVDVDAAPSVKGTLVTLGDSITDGYMSSAGKNRRFPDDLGRLLSERKGATLAVSNAGVTGNELLTNREQAMFGVPVGERLARDVLTQPGLRAVVFLEGINDIGDKSAKADDVIQAMQQVITQVHASGARIYGGTLLPFMGSNATYHADYGTPAGEQERLKVNEWIRTSHAFDGVIDFDKATRDPAKPERMLAQFDSGDHLHPSDAGYEAMAHAVDVDAIMAGLGRH
jgi:lysophospholipase L1-like esterase